MVQLREVVCLKVGVTRSLRTRQMLKGGPLCKRGVNVLCLLAMSQVCPVM